jgi:hypothetical protein
MKRVHVLLLALLISISYSCSKEDNDNGNIELVPLNYGYIPFYPGNYWVYEHYKIDTLGNETLLNHYDSVFISGTETVNGISYIVFEGTWMSGAFIMDTLNMLRDSIGYYVNPSGIIHFTDQNFTDTLYSFTGVNNNTGEVMYESWYKMEPQPHIISVPAGDFEVLNYHGTVYTPNPNQGVQDYRYKDRLFAKNVGMVLDTYYFLGSPTKFERRLIRYLVDQRSAVY